MIKTIYELLDFERLVDFQQDIYFSTESRNTGNILPHVKIVQKVYGKGIEGDSLVVHERLSTVTMDDAGNAPNVYAGINEAIRARLRTFEEEVKRLAETHGCQAIPGTLKPSPMTAALSSILLKRLETLEARMLVVENNYGRALALLEDRIKQVETKELNEVDERLCRLESPPVNVKLSRGLPVKHSEPSEIITGS